MTRFPRFVTTLLTAALAACQMPGPKPPQPSPLTIKSARKPAEAVQAAARSLVADGFDIKTSDAAGGILIASKTATLDKAGDYIVCRWPRTAPGAPGVDTEVTVRVVAQASDSGSDVVITSSAKSAMPNFGVKLQSTDASTDNCATGGLAERHVADALK